MLVISYRLWTADIKKEFVMAKPVGLCKGIAIATVWYTSILNPARRHDWLDHRSRMHDDSAMPCTHALRKKKGFSSWCKININYSYWTVCICTHTLRLNVAISYTVDHCISFTLALTTVVFVRILIRVVIRKPTCHILCSIVNCSLLLSANT